MSDWDEQSPEESGAFLWLIQQVVGNFRGMAMPSIAAVNSLAIGIAGDFGLACDLRVAESESIVRDGSVNIRIDVDRIVPVTDSDPLRDFCGTADTPRGITFQ